MYHINPFVFDSNFRSNDIDLIVYGEPIGKGRPRVTTRGGFARAYTPKRTASYETSVRNAFRSNYHNDNRLEGPLTVTMKAYFSTPIHISKSKRSKMLSNDIKHTKKPDIDNVEKCVLDALNGYAYYDDSQIVRIEAEKFYSDNPRLEIKIKEYSDHGNN